MYDFVSMMRAFSFITDITVFIILFSVFVSYILPGDLADNNFIACLGRLLLRGSQMRCRSILPFSFVVWPVGPVRPGLLA